MSFQPMDLRSERDPDGVERVRVNRRYMQPSAEFDPKTAAKTLMREARSGALATQSGTASGAGAAAAGSSAWAGAVTPLQSTSEAAAPGSASTIGSSPEAPGSSACRYGASAMVDDAEPLSACAEWSPFAACIPKRILPR